MAGVRHGGGLTTIMFIPVLPLGAESMGVWLVHGDGAMG